MAEFLVIDEHLRVPHAELNFSFSRSPGPGGQNVNKVNTKATLHWNYSVNATLPDPVKLRLAELVAKRTNEAGELVVSSSVHRTQRQNVQECLERVRHWVQAAATVPRVRKPTRPSRTAVARRLAEKQARSQTKAQRKPPKLDD